MSFWKTSDGKTAVSDNGEFSSGGGGLIPEGTSVLAAIDEAKWDAPPQSDVEHIALRWNVLAPDEYKGRKVFQKVKVADPELKTSDKAKRMLAAIDANAGGKLCAMDEAPGNADLAKHLMNKPMVLKLGVWDMNGKTGNWVQAVSPRKAGQPLPAAAPATVRTASAPAAPSAGVDEDLPF